MILKAFTILGTTSEKCVLSTNSKQTLPQHFSFSMAATSSVFSSTVAMRFSLAFFSFFAQQESSETAEILLPDFDTRFLEYFCFNITEIVYLCSLVKCAIFSFFLGTEAKTDIFSIRAEEGATLISFEENFLASPPDRVAFNT